MSDFFSLLLSLSFMPDFVLVELTSTRAVQGMLHCFEQNICFCLSNHFSSRLTVHFSMTFSSLRVLIEFVYLALPVQVLGTSLACSLSGIKPLNWPTKHSWCRFEAQLWSFCHTHNRISGDVANIYRAGWAASFPVSVSVCVLLGCICVHNVLDIFTSIACECGCTEVSYQSSILLL